ncbi:MAG: DEAD/DEAH box helicase [Candidatus Woesearchaeota archaeon]
MKFEELNLHPLILQQVKNAGYTEPTAIQQKCIPIIKEGIDLVAQSETGSGKTAAFAIPSLEKVKRGEGIQVLVLTPTRELCIQVSEVFRHFGMALGLRTASIYGGVSINPQAEELRRCEIVVGTPGRIIDHGDRKTLNFSRIKVLIVDEVDKMAEMGFMEQVERIISRVPKHRQTLLFSATLSEEVDKLAESYSRNPVKIITESYVSKDKLKQTYYQVSPREKFSLLIHLLKIKNDGLSLIFCATRNEVDILSRNLRRQGVRAEAIHGGLSQAQRIRALTSLKEGRIQALIATDVAARGLDIPAVKHVYNYDVPKTSEEYVHRIGRTARAGKSGEAITLLSERDYENFNNVLSDRELKIEEQHTPTVKRLPFIRDNMRKREPFDKSFNKRKFTGKTQQREGFENRITERELQRKSRADPNRKFY